LQLLSVNAVMGMPLPEHPAGWLQDYANHQEASRDVTEHIVGFYNNRRLHSKPDYLSPNVFLNEKWRVIFSSLKRRL